MKQISAAWLFTGAVFLSLILPPLLMQGMFMDGMIYGAVARNLSVGQGNFWHLEFSETLLQPFHEHPPLTFYLESLFFRLSGDQYFTERLYTLFVALATVLVLVRLFRLTGGNNAGSWLGVLLWISTERVFWSINQNMLEVTMGFFSLLTLLLLQTAETRSGQAKLIKQSLAGFFLLAAFLSKGFPGLFPLGFYFFRYLSQPGTTLRYFIKNTLLFSGLFMALLGILLFVSDDAWASLSQWFQQQVSGSVQGQDRTGFRLPFISGFFQQLIPMFALISLVLLSLKIKKVKALSLTADQKFLLYTGLSAFIPLLISPKLSFYYFVPAIPYFALFTANYVQHQLKASQSAFSEKKWMKPIALSLLIASLFYSISQKGRASRDEALLGDVAKLQAFVPAGSRIQVSESLTDDWTLFACLQRQGRYSVTRENTAIYLLQSRGEPTMEHKTEILANLSGFRLFSIRKHP